MPDLFARPALAWTTEVLALVLLSLYHLRLYWIYRHDPERTMRGHTNRLRHLWVEAVRAANEGLLGVQTMRNWMTGATVFASTAVVIGISALGLAVGGGDLGALSHLLSVAPPESGWWRLKVLIIAAVVFSAFFHFILALRYYNHAAFLIKLPDAQLAPAPVAAVAATLNRANGHYHRGTRVYIILTPFLLWLLGPDWFFGGMLIVLALLYRFDYRRPVDQDDLGTGDSSSAGDNLPAGDLPRGQEPGTDTVVGPAPLACAHPHALLAEDVLTLLGSRREGLSAEVAAQRLAAVGLNRPPTTATPGLLRQFWGQLITPLIVLVVLGALFTAWNGQIGAALVLLLLALLALLMELGRQQFGALVLARIAARLAPRALVRRDGGWCEVAAVDLVPGDVLYLRSGDRVPADVRLLVADHLCIDESALSGEALSARKAVAPAEDEAGVGRHHSMAYAGTLITAGQGQGVVTATGAATMLARGPRLVAETEPFATPLTRQIERIGRVLAWLVPGLALVLFLFGWLAYGQDLTWALAAALGFALAATPTMLGVILALGLALGLRRLLARQVLVRRLNALETLSAVTVVCADKTGTLTQNQMTARCVVTPGARYTVAGIGYAPEGHLARDGEPLGRDAPDGQTNGLPKDLRALIEVMALCNDAELVPGPGHAWRVVGSPTEGALRTLALKADFAAAAYTRLAAIPFDPNAKLMAALVRTPGVAGAGAVAGGEGRRILVKGAPDRLLARCSTQRGADGEPQPLELAFWEAEVLALSARGLRVLAAAARSVTADEVTGQQRPAGRVASMAPGDARPAAVRPALTMVDLDGELEFLGLVGLIDAPRLEAIPAVTRCRQAGIAVKLMTGDEAGTAVAIADDLGIIDADPDPATAVAAAASAVEIDAADDEQLRGIAAAYDCFARIRPEHRLRLVQALTAQGQVVAITGDGYGDVPALLRADLGIAMGRDGSDAAREAAQIVLADDGFAAIGEALEQGRRSDDNLKKAVRFLLPLHGAIAWLLTLVLLFGLPLPLTPAQVLWLTLVTGPLLALALILEPAEPGLMQRPPRRPGAPVFGGYLPWRIAILSLLIGSVVVAVFLWYEQGQGYALSQAQTLVVTLLVLLQIGFLLSNRRLGGSALAPRHWFGHPTLFWLLAGVLLLQVGFVYAPWMRGWFQSAALAPRDWLLPLGLGLALWLLVELEKALVRFVARRSEARRARAAAAAQLASLVPLQEVITDPAAAPDTDPAADPAAPAAVTGDAVDVEAPR